MFFNDILINSPNFQEDEKHLDRVLGCLREHKFYVKLSKCQLCQPSIEYLGHVVDSQGLHVDKKKIDAMLNWPSPTSVRQLREFLGLTGYYHMFVKKYSLIASSLTDPLKKDEFFWDVKIEEAFQKLKVG